MFNRFIDPDLLLRTYRDPLALFDLAVSLLPIVGILVYGWGAVPLVALYWLENVVIGIVNLLRLLTVGLTQISHLFHALFLSVFFTIHYGMFTAVHGSFLQSFAEPGLKDILSPTGLVNWAIGTGQGMALLVGIILIANLLFFVVDFILKGEFLEVEPIQLMFRPYGRVVTLHIAILLGGALTLALGEPLLGVLLLLVIRIIFGVVFNILRRLRLDTRLTTDFSLQA